MDFLKNEVKYRLEALVQENSIDEEGKKALEILEDKEKLNRIIDKVNNDEEVWEILHRSIEYYMFH